MARRRAGRAVEPSLGCWSGGSGCFTGSGLLLRDWRNAFLLFVGRRLCLDCGNIGSSSSRWRSQSSTTTLSGSSDSTPSCYRAGGRHWRVGGGALGCVADDVPPFLRVTRGMRFEVELAGSVEGVADLAAGNILAFDGELVAVDAANHTVG